MDSTLERLRRLQKLRPQRKSAEPQVAAPQVTPSAQETPAAKETPAVSSAPALPIFSEARYYQPAGGRSRKLETLVPGEVVETEYGELYVATKRYPVDEARGQLTASQLLDHPPHALATLHPQFKLHDALHFADAAFIDTETTGLGGGAGVYAFMVGIGTYEGGDSGNDDSASNPHFAVRQLFMRNPGEEPALLSYLAQLLANKSMTVTFNGRGFDLPLLRARYFFNRGLVADGDMPALLEMDSAHLDLLMPARRLWKRRLQSCRLINLETQILGLQRSGEDVPGHLIPQLYVDYVNSNDARAMQGVFYHNHEDVLSMVGIATEIYRTACPTQPSAGHELDGADWLSLGQIYETQQQWASAESAYRNAINSLQRTAMLGDAFARLGTMLKRLERWQEVTELWERWLTTVSQFDATPYVELAKYHEWHSRDLEQARMWTQWALHSLQKLPSHQQPAGQTIELAHRLARIERKQAHQSDSESSDL